MNRKVSEDEMLHDCNSNEQEIDNRIFLRMTRKVICMSAVLNTSFGMSPGRISLNYAVGN
jgi:hypothetical protein